MSEVYKKFTAQDYAVVPFNAHKQYNFNNQSAHENQLRFYNVSWTSESISQYSSASSAYGSDTIETVKYNQLDHLFYKNFKNDTFNRLGYNNYLIHKRVLYEKAQILSIPAGLYGHEIKPGTFYLSSSKNEIIDDSYGNLIVSGTNINNYPSDIRKNVFRLDPIKGFKTYDLDTIPGYAVKLTDPQNKEAGITKRFWRRGTKHPLKTNNYTTNTNLPETDDSYYFNSFKYNNVEFKKSKLGYGQYKYPSIDFDSIVGSHIMSPHDDKFNFNDENFAISFWIEPKPIGHKILPQSSSIGQEFGGGIVYAIDDDFIYIISNTPIGRYFKSNPWEWGQIGTTVGNIQSGPFNTPRVGDGFDQNKSIIATEVGALGFIGEKITNFNHNGYNDWYIPTLTEIHTAVTNLDIFNPNLTSTPQFANIDTSLRADSITSSKFNRLLTSTEADPNNYMVYISGSLTGLVTPKNIGTTGIGVTTTLPVRRFKITKKVGDNDTTKRYIICKSGTKTVIPSDLSLGTQTIKNTSKLGSLQPLNVLSEPQFPFEIYMQSSSLYFARSDGDNTMTINGKITGSSGHPELHHILCQKSASRMEIHLDGNLIVSAADNLTKQTQNTANLYIGSKGSLSKKDANNLKEDISFYNGSLNNINIFNNSFNTASIKNISESVNASPYIGNIFYQNGFVTFTDQKSQNLSLPSTVLGTNELTTPVFNKRLQAFQYEGENNNPTHEIHHLKMCFNNDGTKLYTTAQPRLNFNGNASAPPFRNPNNHVFQFNLSIPYDIHSADLDGNPAGAGAYLNSTPKALASDPSASYATISSSLKNAFIATVDFGFDNIGSKFFMVGPGYTTTSGSRHPSTADYPLISYYGSSETCPDGQVPVRDRAMGMIGQLPLTSNFDISSGSGGSMDWENTKVEYLDYIEWHSHINGFNAGLIDPATGSPIDETTPLYMTVRGNGITCFTFSDDGYYLYTYHQDFLERNPYNAGANSYKSRTGGADDPFGAGLMSSFVLEEWVLTTPFDITTIQHTGFFIHNDQHTNAARLGNPTLDPSLASTSYRFRRYGKVGRSLDMSTLISPEGYPIKVNSIQFNSNKSKMWLSSQVTSTSFPNGVKMAFGGLGNIGATVGYGNWDAAFAASSSVDPAERETREREGSKIWEYDLLVPGNIKTAQFNKTINLGKSGGVWEQAHPSNVQSFAAGFGASVEMDDKTGIGDMLWHPDGETFLTVNRSQRTLSHVVFNSPKKDARESEPYKVQFQGSHMIFEHEYQCTIDEHEFNDTLNITARKIQSTNSTELADFTTGSLFKPYITTVGLYDENNELLVVGKLGTS